MMFLKRQLAVVVMIMMGVLALSGYFVNWDTLRNFTDKDATNFYMIIAGFAAFLGCLNLIQLHLQKIVYKKENWQYSILTLFGFIIMIVFGFVYNGSDSPMGPHLKDANSSFYWMYNYFYLPLGSTMFALLAFFVASASYRAFRIRNFEASLLLIAGVLVMLGAIPMGALIPSWFFAYMFLFIILAFLAPLFKNKQFFMFASHILLFFYIMFFLKYQVPLQFFFYCL